MGFVCRREEEDDASHFSAKRADDYMVSSTVLHFLMFFRYRDTKALAAPLLALSRRIRRAAYR